ncbi:outer membrane protein assembly factor BamE domain-containing protein [Oxalicibacterium solurbis]|uniref:Lipoprotein n=1 Tax=Oxalicibacterium solurbis TaxID=69280 RepID=A0A8J3ATR0_9BURK|nr:outer membrane protein assembly factor BamE [Oxalicibacterium solurbis]GGI53020.1 lipoprotein [Oxalicibacterium solurbis]
MIRPQKAIFCALLFLSGCAVFQPVTLTPGETEAEVVSKLGRPTARMPDGNGFVLEYNRNPWGQATDMARFDSAGRLISYEQVLTVEKFATLKPGIATKTDVLRTIGHPSETTYLSRQQLEVWTYPYKEYDTWNSLMHVHFDNNGIVNKMENGQDLRFDRDGKFGFFGY